MRQRQTETLLDTGHLKPSFKLPEIKTAAGRVVEVYDSATKQQVEQGMNWYEDVQTIAADMYLAYPARLDTVEQAAGLLALFGPDLPLDETVENAWMFLRYGTSRSLPTINNDAHLLVSFGFESEDILFRGGDNYDVQSMYKNIADPTDAVTVTIDRSARGIIYGDPLAADHIPTMAHIEYEHCSDAFRLAGGRKAIKPSQMQAIARLVWQQNVVDATSATQPQLPFAS